MWEKLMEVGQPLTLPWLILGDFNCVKSTVEKQFGVVPTCDNNLVWCKLDWVLLNNEWLEAGLQCSAHFNPPGCLSDHSPDHPEFIATVEEGWRLNVEGTTQFKLCKKLKGLKNSLKALNRLHYSHISIRAKEADLDLQNAQLHLESNPGDTTVRDSLGALRKKAVFLAEAERYFYYQKAKIQFLKMGDRNTKFFHDMVKRNVAKSSILAITKSDGSTITSEADIGREFVAYFTSLLGIEAQTLPVDSDVFEWGPKLSSEHALELCREVTPSEVKQAIFQICYNKAPGPDGYSACFFKRAWNVVGNQVCTAVMDFFRSGRLLRQLNHCIIALVPKSDHSPMVADYRPISCCNVIYKAITKIIADWLAPILEHLIDRNQAAFVGGRSITNNIFLAQEMVRQYTRKRISPRCTINVYLRKAFDSVNGVYLRGGSVWTGNQKKGDSPLLQRLAKIRNRFVTEFGSSEAAIQHMEAWTNSKGLDTSKAYEYFRPKLTRRPWQTAIWKAFVPPKQESARHLFFECSFSDYVWSHIQHWVGISRSMSTLLSTVKWLKKEKTGSSVLNKARHIALAYTVHSPWRHRNEVIF
ncbi:UNVERIFIED_CONTAM: hypothetical protein Slati_4511500 [Sesamum latifolium]|uniref:Reverse transcriptase domain-containing protein n=1 Tax=Sesamum latifolium TaxID=2727402 RepID=A0AAW2SSS4_9LAMI